ncbi:oligosaccharyl transferase, archaeosortase A system-associated [Natrinema longum]|uniref:dolichyl-phosphooligosaccharide-protein glycotransferase n=1 Tax=Natrinema longum TaxID=370324 RepID=A0A8A2U620_9EURY|nr:oligosaccharyl transferase, archaeosortase A system-associated [Natrinema longum]MBZ6494573.1 oligosaccharyl transferase, archaeosortase A system-associated [Natrinema longum]QSW84107.1 oligosaccharyl transferase, archaeosortase A system-associated [Natrinema longum]
MSTDTEHVEDGTETSILETWREWYHLPVLGVVMLFMVWLRTQAYGRFITDDGTPALAGIDSWYQWRTISWTAENYPRTMPYEVWTGFPSGNYVGQFGTLFDQLIVTAAMIVGLGDPSTETLYAVSLLAIPVMAALVAIPVFYAGRRLGGTIGGIVAVLVLALAKGQFLARSTVGQLDHHVGEVLFMAIAVLAMMVALTVAEREKPIYELVVDGDWDALRTPALYSGLAGLALTLYIWVWPSAVLLIGIFGVFFTVQLCLDYLRGISPDHVAFVGAVSLGVTAVLTALLIERPGSTSSTSFGLLQPLTALLVAAGCVFMAWLARQWNDRDLERAYYPVAVGGLIGAALLVMWLVLPGLFDTIIGNATRRMLPFGGATTDLTIQEATPPEDFFGSVFREFGSAFYTMLAGLAFLAIRPLFDRKLRAEHTLIIVWSLFLISMAATQVRFSYYLLLAVAIVNAAFVAELVRLFDLDLTGSLESLRQVETYQVIVVVLVVLLLFAPLLPPLATATAWSTAENTEPHGSATTWEESNHWLAENTPAPGNYGEPNNADQLDYHGAYSPGDGDYEYPDGSYGVMSWWDYGHLITTQSERIPHSNPFQQNARSSSAYLTAGSEERAELILDGIAAGGSVADKSDAELESLVDGNETDEEIRYVMIDDQMAGGKFSAITRWSGPEYRSYVGNEQYQVGNNTRELPSMNSNYDNTTMASLYLDDATGMEQYRLVHESDEYAIVGSMMVRGTPYPRNSLQLTSSGWNNQTQGIQRQLAAARSNDAVTQLSGIQLWDAHVTSSVKTFERVEGATITGSIDDTSGIDAANATVGTSVELQADTGRTFTYTQQTELAEDGSFEVTVPYATNDALGVDDGHTNSSVEALGNYSVGAVVPGDDGAVQYRGETSVPETAVVNGDTVDVELSELETQEPTEGNETTGNETTGTDETTESSDSESTTDGATTTETAESITPAAVEPAH